MLKCTREKSGTRKQEKQRRWGDNQSWLRVQSQNVNRKQLVIYENQRASFVFWTKGSHIVLFVPFLYTLRGWGLCVHSVPEHNGKVFRKSLRAQCFPALFILLLGFVSSSTHGIRFIIYSSFQSQNKHNVVNHELREYQVGGRYV